MENYYIRKTKDYIDGKINLNILNEKEFKKKLNSKIKKGLVEIILGTIIITSALYVNKKFDKENNFKKVYNLAYVVGGLSFILGLKNTTNYFSHRKDEKPNSIMEKFIL
ncbi:MAG: hypothetical protein WC812_04840 [Candidatus Pacearchaeota archaeon]|jgi:hypothetical protein